MSVRRWLCTRRHSLWILLILLMVCVAIQTFVARQARNDKLTGLPHLRFPVNKQNLFPTLPTEWVSLQPESSPTAQQASRWKKEKFHPTSEPPNSSVLHGTRKGPNGQTLVNTSTTSIFLEPHMNRVYTEASCQPKSRIVFLKTHKTASSTILNILYRYGDSRNLTFALPLNKHSQLFYPFFFTSHFVEGVSSRAVRNFHIMCNHMRFRKSEVAKVMPGDTFYFSILRNPVAMMESIFIYFKSIPAFQKTHSLDDFFDSSWKSFNASLTNNHYAHNVLAFDFGFDNNVVAGADDLNDRATDAIAAIDQDFNLILISEYFDESMILLKHALCWSLEDVVSFRLNSRSERTRRSLSPETAEKIRRWNALDWRIYLHFNATFWHKVDTVVGPEKMRREVSQLRELQAELANTCLTDGGAVDPSQVKDAGLKPFQYGAAVIQGYNLNPQLDQQSKTKCQRLITPELQYTERLYTRQFPEAAAQHRRPTNIRVPQHQRSGRAALMGPVLERGVRRRLTWRHSFSHLSHQEASRRSMLPHTEARQKTHVS
ncbi:galactose-3-O-sulfotransferase 2 [Brachyistius frenatus]|uniref:galactose-3-O-sulfotransferase 2 n=1 Tax=Brachyistius frenatus TaxID=100188 RepID=UPI0037E978CA